MSPAIILGALAQLASNPETRAQLTALLAPLFADTIEAAVAAGIAARAKVQNIDDALRSFTEKR